MAKNKINIPMFQDLLKKSTLNYSIDNVGMVFKKDTFKVGMKGDNSILIIKGANDCISGIAETDEWALNFNGPVKNVKAYFDLAVPDDNEEASITMKDEKMIMQAGNQKSQMFFCSSHLISGFEGDGPKIEGDTVCEFSLNDTFMDAYNVIKKVAGSFGKVYFTVEDNILYIQATDMTNSFANGLKIEIGESEFDDVNVCLDFKTLNNIMVILNGDYLDFTFRIGYVKRSDGGLISFIKGDGTEKYYQLSQIENL